MTGEHLWRFSGLDLDDEGRREALCTLGNGYFATRGAAPEAVRDDVHYPGTYVAGCYDRRTAEVAGQEVTNESMVNLPNWLPLTFRFDDGAWFDLRRFSLVEHEVELDLEHALLRRRCRFRDDDGRTTTLLQRRIVHMGLPHLAALETTLIPEDHASTITFRSGLDGRVRNSGVARYEEVERPHLTDFGTRELSPETVLLSARTAQSRISVAEAARARVRLDGHELSPLRTVIAEEDLIAHEFAVAAGPGQHVQVEKVVALHTSRDTAISEPAAESAELCAEAADFDALLRSHQAAWARSWRTFHFDVRGSAEIRRKVRLHVLHLIQTISPNTADLDVGVPARGLHGEAYRGHVFWDELFVLPVLTLRAPDESRALLMYRYRRLPQARRAARLAGSTGAMFPWQSGSNGREESQALHLNPRSRHWSPDHTRLQRHLGIAIAHNTWRYYQSTADEAFLNDFGAELILDTTRFLARLARYDPARGRYVVEGVVGPDEYHTAYPGAAAPGINNNAYTNVMLAWLCRTASTVLDMLSAHRRRELATELGLHSTDIDHWDRLSRKLFVPFHIGIPDQFEGYSELAELDWRAYHDRYGDIRRLDRILEAEGDDPNRYQASKQADVLMLFYLLSAEELRDVLDRLGYPFPPHRIPETIEHYLRRTSHGSTLSAVVHAWVLARANRHQAWEHFHRALDSDVHGTRGGSTSEGIHLAAMTGTIDLLQRCFAGIDARDGALHLNPCWPQELGELKLELLYRGHPLSITITGRTAVVRVGLSSVRTAFSCACGGREALLRGGSAVRFSLEHGVPARADVSHTP
ncbi:glycoside hydrolase family 65 protein [Saccharopolyspora sp. NFXS83]|uniref:glycoside hydrolase family 65 protein n=1 Tax=Saccharopolyspora sp. NFXS83 TaxID=2993560 RepID=UPI00224B1634|nr:glycosyl hydrolase family 65 protein [Saccharopolyspora sp. NFXS83]MCX2729398.1 glycoside hydrolase family 65 protein [Saccharopolyspora sp. NFXS83]